MMYLHGLFVVIELVYANVESLREFEMASDVWIIIDDPSGGVNSSIIVAVDVVAAILVVDDVGLIVFAIDAMGVWVGDNTSDGAGANDVAIVVCDNNIPILSTVFSPAAIPAAVVKAIPAAVDVPSSGALSVIAAPVARHKGKINLFNIAGLLV